MSINVTGDGLSYLHRLSAAWRAPRMRKVMGMDGAKTVRKNFRQLAAQRHRGGEHNYYAQAARSTTYEIDDSDAFVVIDHFGIRQRIEGGTIKAKPGSALTIPVKDSDAEGRRASEFDDIFVVNRAGGLTGFLARIDAGGELEPLFWLRKSVEQSADPTVLPTETLLAENISTAVKRELDRI